MKGLQPTIDGYTCHSDVDDNIDGECTARYTDFEFGFERFSKKPVLVRCTPEWNKRMPDELQVASAARRVIFPIEGECTIGPRLPNVGKLSR